MRTGLLGKKLGMTRILSDDGCQYAVTLLKIEQHEVLSHKTIEKHGYEAVVVGTIGTEEERRLTKPMQGYFKALGGKFYKKLKEFRVSSSKAPEVGTIYGADFFSAGQYVDVTGISIGKGFAGGMKRHNFRGLRASHGVSVSHRSHGSTGNREDPGKVFKGKKMAGHMGNRQVTLQNLKIYGTDDNLLIVLGSVPGPEGGYVLVKDAIKRKQPQ
ncbi:MAG: 50S ribosomal protein L3 [Holosporaceae bacterium]|jgi:large subunit ribosomal protein L3|nr:50S ribosomal protein L3 [Holosporaceae bacterium]